jgi:hypothetical protein
MRRLTGALATPLLLDHEIAEKSGVAPRDLVQSNRARDPDEHATSHAWNAPRRNPECATDEPSADAASNGLHGIEHKPADAARDINAGERLSHARRTLTVSCFVSVGGNGDKGVERNTVDSGHFEVLAVAIGDGTAVDADEPSIGANSRWGFEQVREGPKNKRQSIGGHHLHGTCRDERGDFLFAGARHAFQPR